MYYPVITVSLFFYFIFIPTTWSTPWHFGLFFEWYDCRPLVLFLLKLFEFPSFKNAIQFYTQFYALNSWILRHLNIKKIHDWRCPNIFHQKSLISSSYSHWMYYSWTHDLPVRSFVNSMMTLKAFCDTLSLFYSCHKHT